MLRKVGSAGGRSFRTPWALGLFPVPLLLRRARCCSVTRVRNLIPAMLCRPTRRAASLLFPLQRVLVTDRTQVFHCVTVTREVCRCVGAANRGSQSDWLTSDADFSIQAVVFVTSGSIPP